jgi:hypothetical protein
MKISLRTVTVICGAFALMLLYLVFFLRFIALADWSSLSSIEFWIFVTMLLRIIVIAVLGRRFQLSPLIPIILFSLESLSLPLVIALFVFTGNPAYRLAMGTILTAWMGVSAVVLSPYLIYDFARHWRTDPSLWGIFFLATIEYAFNLFMATLLSGSAGPIAGFAGLGAYFVLSVKSFATSSLVPFASGSPVITLSSLIFFMSLLIFAIAGHETLETNLKLRDVLFVPIIAVFALIMWSVGIVVFTSNMFIDLSIPVFVLAIAVWGGTRGKA